VDENKHAKKEKYLKKFNNNNERFKKQNSRLHLHGAFILLTFFVKVSGARCKSRMSRAKVDPSRPHKSYNHFAVIIYAH